ncbi:hypothetical protein PHLCEN_2v12636 [Hermanssonia centrifuga]|uniref:Uncharacterized protein n=1 Tax=Hermanssonia centrifuga TaxID=98765 RepID=A0A2R6NGJ9_9APHY|nr:hypothetical protein PHLCEN_2v12636 [Hermanssonia centrifuga]
MSAAPLRLARLASLSMLFAFGIIGMGVGINALVKFNDQKREIKRLVSGGATVNIDTNDVLSSGIVLTVVCGLLAASSLLFLVPLFVATAFGARTLGVQTGILGFLSVWLFATLVPFTDFFANHQAKVTAFFGNITIPQSTIQQIEASMGATSVYRHIDYLRLPAIIPWFTLLFAVIATVLSFLAQRRTKRVSNSTTGYNTSVAQEPVSEKETDRTVEQKA